jgi:hypothetical protein
MRLRKQQDDSIFLSMTGREMTPLRNVKEYEQ